MNAKKSRFKLLNTAISRMHSALSAQISVIEQSNCYSLKWLAS